MRKKKPDPVADSIAALEAQISAEHTKAVEGQLRCEGGMLALDKLKTMLNEKTGVKDRPTA